MVISTQEKPKIIAVVGPTSSGKSDLGVHIARVFGGEILSADSRQVYRGLDIGSGKITKKETRSVPHHMLDIANPKKIFTVSDYVKQAEKIIRYIVRNKKISIIVGGTGFYVDALLGEAPLPDVAPNKKLRDRLSGKTTKELFEKLKKIDSRRAKGIDKHNRRRLIRAIEIAHTLGKVPVQKRGNSKYDTLWIGIVPKKTTLREYIHTRLKKRIRVGMVAEAKRLHERGLSYRRMHELGLEYRLMGEYIRGNLSRAEFESRLENEIWKYSKRQMTWFKKNKKIHWFDPKDYKKIEKLIRTWLKK